jgi:carotenoid cleavage dioxygenase-like enzyme
MLDMSGATGGSEPTRLTEYELNVNTRQCIGTRTLSTEDVMEFPVVHPRVVGQSSGRYVYYPYQTLGDHENKVGQ